LFGNGIYVGNTPPGFVAAVLPPEDEVVAAAGVGDVHAASNNGNPNASIARPVRSMS
jgi:hypothetical protein